MNEGGGQAFFSTLPTVRRKLFAFLLSELRAVQSRVRNWRVDDFKTINLAFVL